MMGSSIMYKTAKPAGGVYVYTCRCQPVLQNIYPLHIILWLISLKAIRQLPDWYTHHSPALSYRSGWCVSLPALHCIYEICSAEERILHETEVTFIYSGI